MDIFQQNLLKTLNVCHFFPVSRQWMHQLYLFLLFLVLVHSPSRCEQAVGDFCQTDWPREKQFSFAPAFYRHVEDLCPSTTTIIKPLLLRGWKNLHQNPFWGGSGLTGAPLRNKAISVTANAKETHLFCLCPSSWVTPCLLAFYVMK